MSSGHTDEWRSDAGAARSAEHVLVCIGPHPLDDALLDHGRLLASALHARWTALYVETPALQRLPGAARDAILARLRRAERLGADTVTSTAPDVAREIVEHAARHGVTRIVVGRPRTGWTGWLRRSAAARVLREAHDVDVHLAVREHRRLAAPVDALLARSRSYLGTGRAAAVQRRLAAYGWSVAAIAACTAVGSVMTSHFEPVNLVMVYLLAVVSIAMRFGRGPSVLASVLGVAAFDFFLVPPYYTFAVSDTEYVITFAVMLITALVISGLAGSMRRQTRVARYREQRMRALFEMSRELAARRDEQELIAAGVRHIAAVFQGQAVVLLPDASGRVGYPGAPSMHGSLHGADLAAAQWVHDRGAAAGLGTEVFPSADAHYAPVAGVAGGIGVLALRPLNLRLLFVPEQRRLLDTLVHLLASSMERARLAAQAHAAEVRMASETLRNALLSSISHDLRTPLASIVGASSTLLAAWERLGDDARRELLHSVRDEAERMSATVTNVLDMARLQAGAVRLNLQWYPLEELVGSALAGMSSRLAGHPVHVALAPGLPLVRLDAVLIERVLANLLENAAKYTAPGTPLEIAATATDGSVTVCVSDRGPGIPPGEEERVFGKFQRLADESAQSGAGLGLAICRAIVEAHGGRIGAHNRPGGGAIFSFSLPLSTPPPVEDEAPVEPS